MALLRIVSVLVGGLTVLALIVLARLLVGIPVLGLLGGRAGAGAPGLPAGALEATVILAGASGGFVAGWIAPDRPVLHALVLGVAGWGLLTAAALAGAPGGPGTLLPFLFPLVVVAGGWLSSRLTASGDAP